MSEKFKVKADLEFHIVAKDKKGAEGTVYELISEMLDVKYIIHGRLVNIMANMVVASKGEFEDE